MIDQLRNPESTRPPPVIVSDLDARDLAQLQLADAIEATVREFIGGDSFRRRLVPRSLGVAVDRLRRRPHRRMGLDRHW